VQETWFTDLHVMNTSVTTQNVLGFLAPGLADCLGPPVWHCMQLMCPWHATRPS